ncbi:hypothetical protein B0H17DRAFT_1032716 [Mycena rosella]|uniref:F-box domain-containing protein n=1 Tax=Mycena rosella TaxID=1033263 RepID=A0AAD7GXP5_MYCRO|nr:hypothetical protein B0H17DRAFT_1032716 [Mycena rosella]
MEFDGPGFDGIALLIQRFRESLPPAREVVVEALAQPATIDPSYIHLLPPEILSLVFAFLIEKADDHWSAIWAFHDLCSCARTCGGWRSILLESPALWAELAAYSQDGICGAFIEQFGLANGAPIALDAIISFPSPLLAGFLLPGTAKNQPAIITQDVLRGLRHPQGHRRIYIESNEFKELLRAMQRPAPDLTSLALKQNVMHFFSSTEVCRFDWELFARTTPNLRHLRLDGFSNVWGSPLIHNLTTLHLSRSFSTELSPVSALSAPVVLSTLRNSPRLEVLHVSGYELPAHIGPQRPSLDPDLVVALPRLRRLELAGQGSGMFALLLHLRIPQHLADGMSLTCTHSSPQMILDIFAYVDHSASRRFEALECTAGQVQLELRFRQSGVEIGVLVQYYVVHTVLPILPFAHVKELTARYDPTREGNSLDLWGLLLRYLSVVERISVPPGLLTGLARLLIRGLSTQGGLVPALRTLALECDAVDGNLNSLNHPRGPCYSYLDSIPESHPLNECIASRRDADGREELEVMYICNVPDDEHVPPLARMFQYE